MFESPVITKFLPWVMEMRTARVSKARRAFFSPYVVPVPQEQDNCHFCAVSRWLRPLMPIERDITSAAPA